MNNTLTLKKITICFLVFIFLTAGAIFAMKAMFTSGTAQSMVEWAMSGAVGGDVSFESLTINPSGKISVSSFSVSVPGGLRITAENFYADIDLSKIFGWNLLIRNVTIKNPGITITPSPAITEQDGEGESNEKSGGFLFFPPIPVEIENLKIDGLSVGHIQKEKAIFAKGISVLSSIKIAPSRSFIKASITTDKTAKLLISGGGRELGLTPKVKMSISVDGDGRWKIKSNFNFLADTLRGFHENTPRDITITATAKGDDVSSGEAAINIFAQNKAAIELAGSWQKQKNGFGFKINPSHLALDTEWLAGFAGIIKANGKLNVANLSATGFYNSKTGAISLTNANATANALIASLETYDVKISRGGKIKIDLDRLALTPEKMDWVAKLEVFMPQLISGGFEFTDLLVKANTEMQNMKGATATGKAFVDLTTTSIAVGDYAIPDISLAVFADGDFTTGNFSKVKIETKIKDHLETTIEGSLKNFGKDSFNVTGFANADLARLIKIPPSDMIAPIRIDRGNVTLELNANGKAGDNWENADAKFTATATVKNASGEIKDKTPLNFSTTDATAKVAGNIKDKFEFHNVTASLNAETKKLDVKNVVSFGPLTLHTAFESKKPANKNFIISAKIFATGVKPYNSDGTAIKELDSSIEIDLRLENDTKLYVDQFLVNTPKIGLVNSLDGYIDGINVEEARTNGIDMHYIYDRLSFNLTNHFSIALDDRQRFLTDMDVTGEATAEIALSTKIDEQSGTKVLQVTGESELYNITIHRDNETIVSDLTGKLPFSKTLRYGAKNGDTTNRSIVEPTKNVTAKFANIGPVTLDDILLDFYFKESTLGVDYFKAGLLDGRLTGSFHIKQDGELYILKTTDKFVGLNLTQLIKKDLGLSAKESEIDGAISVGISFKKEDYDKEIDIDSIDASLSLSKIGPKAFGKLLKFLDPKENSPTIAAAKTVLKFAKPSNVEITIKRGNLSVSMGVAYAPLLGGAKIKMPIIKRTPINSFVSSAVIDEYLKKLSTLKVVMRAVGSTHFFVAEDGSVKLQ